MKEIKFSAEEIAEEERIENEVNKIVKEIRKLEKILIKLEEKNDPSTLEYYEKKDELEQQLEKLSDQYDKLRQKRIKKFL